MTSDPVKLKYFIYLYICINKILNMKKLAFFLLITAGLAFTITSCGGEDGEEKESDSQSESTGGDDESDLIDLSDMALEDLSDHGLPTKIKLPQIPGRSGDIIPFTVENQDDFRWFIQIGEEGDLYRLIIENAEGFENIMEDQKNSFQSFFTIDYIVEEEDIIMYKKTVKSEESVPEQYHIFGVVEIGGIPYKVMSDWTIPFNKLAAKRMYKSVKSLQLQQKDKEAA